MRLDPHATGKCLRQNGMDAVKGIHLAVVTQFDQDQSCRSLLSFRATAA
jgi:hypothetical protein